MNDSTTSSSITFKVSDKKVECVKNSNENVAASETSICSQLISYNHNHCTEVLMETQFSSGIRGSRNNGFVQTVIDCYNNHHNLVIRPDDIWTAILTQFSFYINKNAEEFRSQFVDFEGKKELVVEIVGTLRAAPYDAFVTKMTEKIDENLVDKTVKDWILPNFTTTTTNDIISCGTIFMGVTKKYFEFACMLLCGIPYVTLEGTVADWENILSRLEKLKSYKLDSWYDMLRPILEEFIAAKKNNVNIEFWNRICHHLSGGSGPSYISGWLTAFAIFDEEGNYTCSKSASPMIMMLMSDDSDDSEDPWPLVDVDKIPSGCVSVDVKIVDENEEFQSLMFAGHVGYEVLSDNCTLKPQIGWGIALKRTDKEVNELHETYRGESTLLIYSLIDIVAIENCDSYFPLINFKLQAMANGVVSIAYFIWVKKTMIHLIELFKRLYTAIILLQYAS